MTGAESANPVQMAVNSPVSLPTVSVVMPVRNEAAFVARSVKAVLDQAYPPELLEVIVADGMSDDGTREILDELTRDHPNLRVLDNTGRIVPTGLNAAIKAASGDIIIRVDGHCDLEADFVLQSVSVLQERPDAWSVGGPIVHEGKSLMGRAIAIAMSHPLGVGNATHRFESFEGYVEGAQFPTLPKWVFERVGYFDETLVRNQDDEFNYRINKAGGRVFISPRIRFRYYVREKLRQLLRQYFQYGFWRIPVMKKHRRPTTPRQLAPPVFFLSVVVLAIAGLVTRNPAVALFLPSVYCAVLLFAGVSASLENGWRVGLRVPVAIAVMHAGYAFGLLFGAWATKFNPHAWTSAGRHATLSR